MSRYAPSAQALRDLKSLVEPACRSQRKPCIHTTWQRTARRAQHTDTTSATAAQPFHAHTKQEAKTEKFSKRHKQSPNQRLADWNLTVGLEIHAELSSPTKLFSTAATPLGAPPNTHATVFDAALPGAQPQFQKFVLLPALRAALALGCKVQEKSSWDRKHYFWWDQPQGYQITQYHEPFAKNGKLVLHPWDEVDAGDSRDEAGDIVIGIKQVQLEQDTAKTVLQPHDTHFVDLNRAGLTLVEIITRPEIKSAKTAAAVVKKVQSLLQAVGANTTGMEMGGLRCDVNVSVRRQGHEGKEQYDGVRGLGTRTETKNLSSFKAVEEAILAERDRQIEVLENGGFIEGETRGWTIGGTSTRKLRGKEGEVDYRYMPDPDLAALRIGSDLVEHVMETLPQSPDDAIRYLTSPCGRVGLSVKDAKTLATIDDGERIDFFYNTVKYMGEIFDVTTGNDEGVQDAWDRSGKAVANFILMDLPTWLKARDLPFPYHYGLDRMEPGHPPFHEVQPVLGSQCLGAVLIFLLYGQITQRSARLLLDEMRFPKSDEIGDHTHWKDWQDGVLAMSEAKDRVDSLITRTGLWFVPLSHEELDALARQMVKEHPGIANKARQELMKTKGRKRGKLMWLVGQMVRTDEDGRVQAKDAERYVWNVLADDPESGLEKWLHPYD